jgi:1-deoxy-D-xylulose-5-phosphate reductoisomerase
MASGVKRIAILGSTGSIGQQALDIIRAFPARFQVGGLAAGKNIKLLTQQLEEFKPEMFYCSIEPDFSYQGKFMPMEEMVGQEDIDFVVVATSGKAGLFPTIAALQAGKTVALANKEVLVMAGDIVTAEAHHYGVHILPIDSEHSAIWQCLLGEESQPHRLFLTASGGPFYRYPQSKLDQVTAEQALHHPVWKMGKKVTIDSATLLNKGLEVIEAHYLFAIPLERIEILIHPQSIIHTIVEFVDGSLKAQLGFPDMRLPIQYALCYPERLPNPDLPRLDLSRGKVLTLEPVDYAQFPCLKLALDVAKSGGTYPAVLCAADEVAVELFLQGKIRFTDIATIVSKALEQHQNIAQPSIEEILAVDEQIRETTLQIASQVSLC